LWCAADALMSSSDRRVSGLEGVSIELPESLREAPELTGEGVALAAVAEPWPWPDDFRPCLMLETGPLAPDRATIRQLSSRLIADLLARQLHVATCDVWMAPDVEDGRRIISLFAAMDSTIIRMEYVGIRGGRSVLFTIENDASNYRTATAIFRDAVNSLRCDGEYPVPDPDPETMPRLDPILRERGIEIEDLSGIRGVQPYASAGAPLREDQIDALRSGKLRRVDTAALEERGFVSRGHRLTEGGEAAHRALETPARRVTAEAVSDRDPRVARLEILQRQHASVILAHPPTGASPAGRTLDLVATGTTAIALARWLGLAPAWTIAISDEKDGGTLGQKGVGILRLEGAVLDARLASAEAPPPNGARDGLVGMWTQPWQVVTLYADKPVERVVRVIATPEAGYFRLERDQETGEGLLTPLPSAHLLLELLWYGGFDVTLT
jgi:hypothetical protein